MWYGATTMQYIVEPYDVDGSASVCQQMEEYNMFEGWKRFEACGEECLQKAESAVRRGQEPNRCTQPAELARNTV
jgi:hypothetical protein